MKLRMVDRITDYECRRSIRGTKTVSFEEYQLKAAFGGPAVLPPTLLIETLLQLANWLIVLSTDFRQMGLVVRIGQVRFVSGLGPGERLDMEVRARRWRDDGIVFDGVGRVGDRVIAEGDRCLATATDLASYCDPADLRVLFSQIHRPEGRP